MKPPLIIIGAPRSGTNMLRDLLVKLNGLETWPCDEINYIWRHGNRSYSSDEFTASMASPSVKSYIRGQFDTFARQNHNKQIVEKTCANSLRVQFVDQVFPQAKYIFIVRDGVDSVASATHRWKAKLDLNYILRKARYVPPSDLPYYASKYIYTRIYKLFSSEKRLSLWGPQLDDLDSLLETYTLEQVCAIQWQRCVENAEQDFSNIASDRIYKIKYEDFVSSPKSEFIALADYLGQPVDNDLAGELTDFISNKSIGKGRNELGFETTDKILSLINHTLERQGYA